MLGGPYPSPQAPFEHSKDPVLGDSPGCLAQAHTWLSFSPCPLPEPGGRPPLLEAADMPQSLGWVGTDSVF